MHDSSYAARKQCACSTSKGGFVLCCCKWLSADDFCAGAETCPGVS